MRVLITSGGTKVPIDRVRDITNMSRGTFGSKIAHEALEANHEVTFLCANGSRTPFSHTFDFYGNGDWEAAINRTAELYNFCEKHRRRYMQVNFRNFSDYQEQLHRLLTGVSAEPANGQEETPPDPKRQPDIIILAAAVSDFGVANYVDGKIRSAMQQQINMTPYPKVIGKVKIWAPKSFLVGFKLMVDSTDEELYAAARASIDKNGCDLVVANDLRDIKQGNHRLMLVSRDDKEPAYFQQSDRPDGPNYLARVVVQVATEMASCETSSSE